MKQKIDSNSDNDDANDSSRNSNRSDNVDNDSSNKNGEDVEAMTLFGGNGTATLKEKKEQRKWIHPHTFYEGISGWRFSLAELFMLSDALGATLVEPCMKNGRLSSCHLVPAPRIPISQIFDMSVFKKSSWAPYEDFQEDIAKNKSIPATSICLDWHEGQRLHPPCLNRSRYYQSKKIPELAAFQQQGKGPRILEIYGQFKRSLFGTQVTDTKTIDKRQVVGFVKSKLLFRNEHYDRVKQLLNEAKIDPKKMVVVHWRGEKDGLKDYVECAKAIGRSQAYIKNNSALGNNSTFLLMSSLHQDATKMWAGSNIMANNTNSMEALNMLIHDYGFSMLDGLLEQDGELPDLGMMSIYDLILAEMSQIFSTCSQRCRHKKFCNKRNWLGNFANMAVETRETKNKQKNTYSCWPGLQ